jgi:hypothetical protein
VNLYDRITLSNVDRLHTAQAVLDAGLGLPGHGPQRSPTARIHHALELLDGAEPSRATSDAWHAGLCKDAARRLRTVHTCPQCAASHQRGGLLS